MRAGTYPHLSLRSLPSPVRVSRSSDIGADDPAHYRLDTMGGRDLAAVRSAINAVSTQPPGCCQGACVRMGECDCETVLWKWARNTASLVRHGPAWCLASVLPWREAWWRKTLRALNRSDSDRGRLCLARGTGAWGTSSGQGASDSTRGFLSCRRLPDECRLRS